MAEIPDVTAHFGEKPEELLPVYAKCGCGKRAINVKLYPAAVAVMQKACAFEQDDRIGTWWCWRCKEIGILTAKSLHIAA